MSHKLLIAIAVYFGLIALLSLIRTRPIKSARIDLFRAFFPSWKFFDIYGEAPRLEVRLSESDSWRALFLPLKRNPLQFIYNPEGAYRLAAGSVLSQIHALVNEGGATGANFEDHTLFKLTKNLVEFELKKCQQNLTRYQFRIVIGADELVQSRVIEVRP